MIPDLSHRLREDEWMDAPDANPDALRRSLRFIRNINGLLGYTRATIAHLQRMSAFWKPGESIHIIDLATGSADIPLAILHWAEAGNHNVRIVGIDRHPTTAATAARAAGSHSRLRIIQADVLAMPFCDDSFDYAITSMFLHHLDDVQVVKVMATMNRLARRGVIVADLLRHRRAYLWIKLLTLAAQPMVRHDAAVSVAQAFTQSEVMELARRAGLAHPTYHRHFGHRFVLTCEKTLNPSSEDKSVRPARETNPACLRHD